MKRLQACYTEALLTDKHIIVPAGNLPRRNDHLAVPRPADALAPSLY
jgi:hypothetical protein